MMQAVSSQQADFYREFLMTRGRFDPNDYGISLGRDELMDQMVDDFNSTYKGQLTVDELVLRPRTAMWFCDHVRQLHAYYDLPDDLILRSIMNRRKKG